jgi:hypothetical protein
MKQIDQDRAIQGIDNKTSQLENTVQQMEKKLVSKFDSFSTILDMKLERFFTKMSEIQVPIKHEINKLKENTHQQKRWVEEQISTTNELRNLDKNEILHQFEHMKNTLPAVITQPSLSKRSRISSITEGQSISTTPEAKRNQNEPQNFNEEPHKPTRLFTENFADNTAMEDDLEARSADDPNITDLTA